MAGATGYDLYFGEDVIEPLVKIDDLPSPSMAFPVMETGKTYYWHVVAHTPRGDIEGPYWWFQVNTIINILWQDNSPGNDEIYLKRSIDGGATWTSQRISKNAGASLNPAIAVDGSNIYVTWQDDTYGNDEIFFKKSSDGGATWTFQRLT